MIQVSDRQEVSVIDEFPDPLTLTAQVVWVCLGQTQWPEDLRSALLLI